MTQTAPASRPRRWAGAWPLILALAALVLVAALGVWFLLGVLDGLPEPLPSGELVSAPAG